MNIANTEHGAWMAIDFLLLVFITFSHLVILAEIAIEPARPGHYFYLITSVPTAIMLMQHLTGHYPSKAIIHVAPSVVIPVCEYYRPQKSTWFQVEEYALRPKTATMVMTFI